MATGARVESLDALRAFRTAMCKFGEAANIALCDAEAELQRTQTWLETEQASYWAGQIRKRQELVARCKEAVRMKTLFKNAAGSRDSAVDEQKALAVAMKQLEEATQKLANVKLWARRLAKELSLYKGAVQRFATSVQSGIPVAVSRLDQMVVTLEQYLALTAPSAPAAEMVVTDQRPTMARGEGMTIEDEPKETLPAGEPQSDGGESEM
ncbi:MAG: hypothetical protein NTU53_08165 [Planctomycetota bacterium]|nr:hypothetical protein [Planctomycetota bacterium]